MVGTEDKAPKPNKIQDIMPTYFFFRLAVGGAGKMSPLRIILR